MVSHDHVTTNGAYATSNGKAGALSQRKISNPTLGNGACSGADDDTSLGTRSMTDECQRGWIKADVADRYPDRRSYEKRAQVEEGSRPAELAPFQYNYGGSVSNCASPKSHGSRRSTNSKDPWSAGSDSVEDFNFWRWVWAVPRYTVYRCGRSGFFGLLRSSPRTNNNGSFSLAGLLLGITLGMFVGFFLQNCGRYAPTSAAGGNFGRMGGGHGYDYEIGLGWDPDRPPFDPDDPFMVPEDQFPPGPGPAGKYRYHSAQEDAGYEPRVISSLSSNGGGGKVPFDINKRGLSPIKDIPPAGTVKLVRPYHLATELGIVSKVAIAFVAGDGPDEWELPLASDGTNGSVVKEARLMRVLRQLFTLETSLKRQFISPPGDDDSGSEHPSSTFSSSAEGATGSTFTSRFSVQDGSFAFGRGDRKDSSANANNNGEGIGPPVLGKVLYFVRASAPDAAILLKNYFPHLLPLVDLSKGTAPKGNRADGKISKVNKGPSDKEQQPPIKNGDDNDVDDDEHRDTGGRDVAAMGEEEDGGEGAMLIGEDIMGGAAVAEGPQDSDLDDESFLRMRKALGVGDGLDAHHRRRKRARDDVRDRRGAYGVLGKLVKIVALDAHDPADFVTAILTYLVDNHMYDHENVYMARAGGTYLRLNRFTHFVSDLRRGQPVYVGEGRYRRQRGEGSVGLPPSYHINEDYCMLDAGFVLGQAEILAVKNNMPTCLDDGKLFDKIGVSEQVQHIIGTCISQILQQNCSPFINDLEYVATNYTAARPILRGQPPASLADVERFNRSFVVYGIPSIADKESKEVDDEPAYVELEFYFTDIEIRSLETEIEGVRSELERLQSHIPDAKDEIFFTYGIPPRTKPRNHFEVLNWIYFNMTHSLLPNEVETVKLLNEREKAEISEVLEFAKTKFSTKYPNHIFTKLINGYKQHDPTRGIEYILDLEFFDASSSNPLLSDNAMTKRCHVMRPTGVPKIVYVNNDDDLLNDDVTNDPAHHTLVRYVVVPVMAGDAVNALQFLKHYRTSGGVTSFHTLPNVRLLIVFVVLDVPDDPKPPSQNSTSAIFIRAQKAALDPVKREVSSLKRTKAAPNLGWFTVTLPATPAAANKPTPPPRHSFGNDSDTSEDDVIARRALASYAYDGSLSVAMMSGLARKIFQKYGDDRLPHPAKGDVDDDVTNNGGGSSKGKKRYVNVITTLSCNARLSANDFLVRVMGNIRRGRKVAFAVPFQRYDPKIAKPSYEGKPADYVPGIHDIRTSVGRYDNDNWGIASFYLSDFVTVMERYFNRTNLYQGNADTTDLSFPPGLDIAELFLADRGLELFRYVEPFAVLEHVTSDLDCLPSPSCSGGGTETADPENCDVIGYAFAMKRRVCSYRKYSNAGTNTQLAFRVFENQLGINMSQYETIMSHKNKVKKYVGG